jgi:hypothetical protein
VNWIVLFAGCRHYQAFAGPKVQGQPTECQVCKSQRRVLGCIPVAIEVPEYEEKKQ